MSHDIAAPDPRGSKTGASGAYGPSWDPDDDDPASPAEQFHRQAWCDELDRERMNDWDSDIGDLDRRRYELMRSVRSSEPKPRTLHHVTLRVPVMATDEAHAKAQVSHMARSGFGSRCLFEVLKVEAPDEY